MLSLALAPALLMAQGLLVSPQMTAQTEPVRIEVMHADPWLIVSLLQGVSPPYPEISTAALFLGQPMQPQQGGGWLIAEGVLVVNPADNSIWYLPKRTSP